MFDKHGSIANAINYGLGKGKLLQLQQVCEYRNQSDASIPNLGMGQQAKYVKELVLWQLLDHLWA